MNHLVTSLISPEEASKLGADAPPVSVVLALMKTFSVPINVHASNVRSVRRQDRGPIMVQGMVSTTPLVYGDQMVLIESAALLLGFYNNGFDEDRKPVIVAAYGKPMVIRAQNVTVGPTLSPSVYSSVFHYEEIVLFPISEIDTKKTQTLETPQ